MDGNTQKTISEKKFSELLKKIRAGMDKKDKPKK